MNNADVAAERAVLSSLFTYGHDAYVEISDLVGVNSFTVDSNQMIYKCAEHLLKEHKDAILDMPSILSSAHSLNLKQFFDSKEELNHLRAVMNFPIERENVRRLAAKVKKLEITRHLGGILNKTKEEVNALTGDEPLSHILGLVENPIFDFSSSLNETSQEGPKLIFDDYKDFLEYRMANTIEQLGLSSGFKLYDNAIGGGFRDGTVNVILARMKAGKSSHADNVAINNIGCSVPTLMLDTEMSKDEHRPRMAACLSGVPIRDIETGACGRNANARKKVLEAAELLKDLPYHYLNICGQPFEDTLAEMRRWLHKTVGFKDGKPNPCLIILDYLKMQSSDPMSGNDMKEYQVLGFMTTSLVNFAQKYKVPILTYVQLNRDGITREDTDIVAGSDRIGWFASNLTILKRQSNEEIAAQYGNPIVYNTKLVPLVARHGAGLDEGDFIHYKFHKEICKFSEGPLNSGIQNNSAGQAGRVEENDDQPNF